MRRLACIPRLITLVGLALTLGACAADSTTGAPTTTPALVVRGSGAPAGASMNDGGDLVTGAAASLTIKLYALYISTNADCSAPTLVQDLGASGESLDFMTNPVLFTGTPADGSYHCVMMKMSDVLQMKPATTFGGCGAGTNYTGDIYRDGDSGWVDVNLNPVTASGTDDLPVDNHVTIFMSQDTSAAIARGIDRHQLVALQSSLIVPGQTTFRMDATHAVITDGVLCGINKPVMSFQ